MIVSSPVEDQTPGDMGSTDIPTQSDTADGRVTRIKERSDEGASSSDDTESDDITIDSYTECESDCEDPDHHHIDSGKMERLEEKNVDFDHNVHDSDVMGAEPANTDHNGKWADDLSLQSFNDEDFLTDGDMDIRKTPLMTPMLDSQLICVRDRKPQVFLPPSVRALRRKGIPIEVFPNELHRQRARQDREVQWEVTKMETIRMF